jgi:hypothetical protein
MRSEMHAGFRGGQDEEDHFDIDGSNILQWLLGKWD